MMRREPLEQAVRPVEAAGPDQPGDEPRVLDQEPVRVGDPDPGADRQQPLRLGDARQAEVDRQRDAFGPAGGQPGRDRVRVEAELGGHVAGERGLGAERVEQRPVGDEGVTLRVGRDPDLGAADGRSRPSPAAATGRPGSRPAPWRRHRRRRRDRRRRPRARRSAPTRWARSRIIRAERCGTARKPRAWSCSHSATVASIPLAGDAVTDTVAPGGRKAAWSSAFLSGTSSKVGARRTRPAPPRGPASARSGGGTARGPRPRSPASTPCAGR